jgi:hypothetical protein
VPARPGIVGLNVSPAARDAARSLSFTLTGLVGERVTMDRAILAACQAAAADPAAAADILRADRREAS